VEGGKTVRAPFSPICVKTSIQSNAFPPRVSKQEQTEG